MLWTAAGLARNSGSEPYAWNLSTIIALFGPIGHIPPAEAGANYYAAIEALDKVA